MRVDAEVASVGDAWGFVALMWIFVCKQDDSVRFGTGLCQLRRR